MQLKYDEIVKKEVEDMLKARIIKPACGPWGFPVEFSHKSVGNPRFCVDYRALNMQMKEDKFPMSKVEEMIDIIASANIFSKLDTFAG